MMGSAGRRRASAIVFFLSCVWLQTALALTDEQQRGKQIYLRGTSASGGQVMAMLGREGVSLPASAVPCASCHGPDGMGRPEGGLIPPNIRWSELSKSYGHVHENGRRHPVFNEAGVAKLVRTGVDPGGNQLDNAMPRYKLSEPDMADLLAYLKYIEMDLDPGLSEDQLQIATLLPLDGPQGQLGRAMAQVIHAYLEDVNRTGGVYGRRLELLAIPFGATQDETLDKLRQALRIEGIFALVGSYTVGVDQPLLELLRKESVPLIGPFTLDPGNEVINPAAFYLYPGFVDQVQVLAKAAVEEKPADAAVPPVLIGPEGNEIDRLVNAAKQALQAGGRKAPQILRYPPGRMQAGQLAEQLAHSESLLYFGQQNDLEDLLASLAEHQSKPAVYLLSSFVSRPLYQASTAFQGQIFLAYPTLSRDITPAGSQAYQKLAQEYALPPDHLQAQISAYAASKLFVEGLRKAGRSLNRSTLVDAIEALYQFDTGVTPPLTYGPNRRVGARGAYLVSVDLTNKSYKQVGGWREAQ